jgi:hypothetical protein
MPLKLAHDAFDFGAEMLSPPEMIKSFIRSTKVRSPRVEHADVAGMEPAVTDGQGRFLGVAPIPCIIPGERMMISPGSPGSQSLPSGRTTRSSMNRPPQPHFSVRPGPDARASSWRCRQPRSDRRSGGS